ncbi:MAG TPA: hypothetical protein ENF97_00340 [Candidatus Omnitrophica bacterium]|nr:hypothetical protein [Candidatus Omnitrophota bacterium]
MKRLFLPFALLISISFLGYSEESKAEGQIIFSDKLESVSLWQIGGHKNGKKRVSIKGQYVEKSWEIKYKGSPCLKLHYNFTTSGEDAAFIKRKVNINCSKESILRLILYGDNSKHLFFVVLKDKSGESHFFFSGRIFWRGWKTVKLPLSKLFTPPAHNVVDGKHWGGDENQVLNPPITEITIGLSDRTDSFIGEGDIYLAEVSVLEPQQGKEGEQR